MLQQIDFATKRGQNMSLALGDVSTGVILTEIAGLDPVKATLVSTNFAMRDGTQHQAARRESRDIIIRMNLDSRFGGVSVSQIRRNLYAMFMSKTELTLTFHSSDMASVEISGIVEDVASERFTKDPTFGMSIHCNDPDFIDISPKQGEGEGYSGSLAMHEIDYAGSVDAGIDFEIDISGSGSGNGFVLQQITPRGDTKSLIFDAELKHNDTIVIRTHPGVKEVAVRRADVETSILYGIDPQSQWPILEPGLNQIGVQVTGGTYQSYYQYKWHDRFGGL